MAKSQLLTNYGLVLIHVALNPDSTLRDIAVAVGITERAILGIIRTMEADGLISSDKRGRGKHYSVKFRALMRVPIGGPFTLKELIEGLSDILRRLEEGDDSRSDEIPPEAPDDDSNDSPDTPPPA